MTWFLFNCLATHLQDLAHRYVSMVRYVLTARNDFVFFVDREMRPEGRGLYSLGYVTCRDWSRFWPCSGSAIPLLLLRRREPKSEEFLFPFWVGGTRYVILWCRMCREKCGESEASKSYIRFAGRFSVHFSKTTSGHSAYDTECDKRRLRSL